MKLGWRIKLLIISHCLVKMLEKLKNDNFSTLESDFNHLKMIKMHFWKNKSLFKFIDSKASIFNYMSLKKFELVICDNQVLFYNSKCTQFFQIMVFLKYVVHILPVCFPGQRPILRTIVWNSRYKKCQFESFFTHSV